MSDAMQNQSVVDLAIVGAGPVGLFAAFYAGLRQMSVLILDSLDSLGGQLIALYPEKYIYDVAGFPKVLAKDLVRHLEEQALQYGPAVALGEQVRRLDYAEGDKVYTIHTARGAHRTRTILIAAGVGAFQPKRLPLANAAGYEGRGLHYFVKSMEEFRGQRVLIVGGGDSAVDWANTLHPVARSVTLIHRRDQFRAHEDSVAKMRSAAVTLKLFYELKSLGGEGQVQHAIIYDNRSKEEETVEVDAVLVNIGFVNALGPIAEWGLELEGAQIKVDGMMRSSRPGIFAAGDIATFAGKLKLIATGFGEACVAVNYAKNYLDPEANVFPGHSSNLRG